MKHYCILNCSLTIVRLYYSFVLSVTLARGFQELQFFFRRTASCELQESKLFLGGVVAFACDESTPINGFEVFLMN